MSAGYGRGYYGGNQLARSQRRGGAGWIKLALVVGAGAAIWLLWPRKAAVPLGLGLDGAPPKPPLPPVPEAPGAAALAQLPTSVPAPALLPWPVARSIDARPVTALPGLLEPSGPNQVAQLAQSRGYPSTREYEDAVVASAKQLQDSGAKVVLAPHLAHLAARLA